MGYLNHFFFLLILSLSTSLNGRTQLFNISGYVKDSLTQEPLVGVYITNGKDGAQTDYNGRYIIKGVSAQDLTLRTMYYSAYRMQCKSLSLQSDTTADFLLAQQMLHLNEVVVTGTRTEKRWADTPVLTTVVGQREIEKAGAVSALEVLEDNIPGIVSDPNAMGNNLRIKGLNSRYILFLIDGERMVSEGAGGNVNLNQIDVTNIKRVEVINGAASALYGSNAVGAVINIITKEPIHKLQAGAHIHLESQNTLRTKIDFASNIGRFKARVNGFRHSSNGFGGDGKGAYAAAYTDWGSDLKLQYNPIEQIDLHITGRYFRHETFNPQGSLNTTHPLSHTMSVGFSGGYTTTDEKYKLRASVHFDKYFDNDYLEKLKSTQINNTATYISTRVLNTIYPSKKWEVVAGLEYNHEENYATKTLGAVPAIKQLDDINLLAQAQYTPVQDLDIVWGMRYTYNTQFKSAFTPKLSLMYRLKGFTFRGGGGTAFRAPTIKELYYNFDHQGMFWVYGNPDLKAEIGLYTSLSAEYTRNNLNISLSGYWNNIYNKITQYDVVNTQGGNEKYYKNVSSATLLGIDLNISYTLFKDLVLKGNYSYCNAKDNSTGLQLSSNVLHSMTVSATWNGKIFRSPFSLQLAGRVHSPKLYQQIVSEADGESLTELSESKVYNIWKVVLVKPFRIRQHTMEITLKCDNLFDFKDPTFINPGRQYMIGLRYAFN